MKKILFAGVAVLLLAAGCESQTASNIGVDNSGNANQSVDTSNTQQAQTTPQPTQANNTMTMDDGSKMDSSAHASATASDNAALNSSLTGIDGQLTNLNSDSSNVDSSMNEQSAP